MNPLCLIKDTLKKSDAIRQGHAIVLFYWNYYRSRRLLLQQFKDLDKIHSATLDVLCPICGQTDSVSEVSQSFKSTNISKLFCRHCHHLHSNWLANNLERTQELFDYNTETTRKYEQKYLLSQAIKYSGKRGWFLDFGVGGNISASIEMQKEFPENIFYACDLNYRDEKNYFVTYTADEMIGRFSGITSNSVIEHLGDTIQTWRYFNQLLKPGGYMVHSFPSQLHFDWSHWGLTIKSHVCLFSDISLNQS